MRYYNLWKNFITTPRNYFMKGLCHACLKSNIDVEIIHGKITCQDCQQKNAKN